MAGRRCGRSLWRAALPHPAGGRNSGSVGRLQAFHGRDRRRGAREAARFTAPLAPNGGVLGFGQAPPPETVRPARDGVAAGGGRPVRLGAGVCAAGYVVPPIKCDRVPRQPNVIWTRMESPARFCVIPRGGQPLGCRPCRVPRCGHPCSQ